MKLQFLPPIAAVFVSSLFVSCLEEDDAGAIENIEESNISYIETKIDFDEYLEDVTQPIAPSVAIGRLTRMEAIGEKSVNEARHAKVKQRLERLKNAVQRMENGFLKSKKPFFKNRFKFLGVKF